MNWRPILSAVPVAAWSSAALAQANQTLIIALDDGSAVPLSGWTAFAISVVLGIGAFVLLRRGGRSRFVKWCLVAVVAGAVAGPLSDAGAGPMPDYTINLIASPAILVVPPPGKPLLDINVINATGKTVTIKSIALTAGAYTIAFSNCKIGLGIAPGDFCSLQLGTGGN